MKQVPFLRILTASLLVTGTTVGAGILALPIQTGLAGVLPSLVGLIVMWGLMLISGRILALRLTRSGESISEIGTLYESDIGAAGKWLSTFGYFVMFYGVLTAYLAGATSVLVSLVPLPVPRIAWTVGFFLVATGLTVFGENIVRRGNAAIMTFLTVAFALLLIETGSNVEVARFHHSDWPFLLSAMPIIACAFAYHCIIPAVCRSLDWDFRLVWKAICFGTTIALVMNITWILTAVGAIPVTGEGQGNLMAAFEANLPATVPLSLILDSTVVTTLGLVFAFSAILTSYLGVGTGLLGFVQDFASSAFGVSSRRVAAGLTFGPPLVIALVYPNIFLKMLNIVGGVGILLVFGILPCLVYIKSQRDRPVRGRWGGYLLLGVFGLLMVLELAQEAGWLQIKPNVEHWIEPHLQ